MTDVYESLVDIKKEQANNKFYIMTGIVIVFFSIIIVLFYIFLGCVIVQGPSMENTLKTNDALITYLRADCSYGDIIIIEGEKKTDKLVKRVIGMGGDTVKTVEGYVYLKKAGENEFTKLNESYVKEQGATYSTPRGHEDISETFIPEGEIYYLGDNRRNSSDSRSEYGTCKKSQVVGVVATWSLGIKSLLGSTAKLLKW